jgi:hypothetical protein
MTRIKSIHHINIVPMTEPMVALIRPFLKKEIYKMVIVTISLTNREGPPDI